MLIIVYFIHRGVANRTPKNVDTGVVTGKVEPSVVYNNTFNSYPTIEPPKPTSLPASPPPKSDGPPIHVPPVGPPIPIINPPKPVPKYFTVTKWPALASSLWTIAE